MRKPAFVLRAVRDGEVCPICLGALRAARARCVVAALPCGHAMHIACARAYARRSARDTYGESRVIACPYCRAAHAYVRPRHATGDDDDATRRGGVRVRPSECWRPSGIVRARAEACYAIVLAQIKMARIAAVPRRGRNVAFWIAVVRARVRRRFVARGCYPPTADEINRVVRDVDANDVDLRLRDI